MWLHRNVVSRCCNLFRINVVFLAIKKKFLLLFNSPFFLGMLIVHCSVYENLKFICTKLKIELVAYYFINFNKVRLYHFNVLTSSSLQPPTPLPPNACCTNIIFMFDCMNYYELFTCANLSIRLK